MRTVTSRQQQWVSHLAESVVCEQSGHQFRVDVQQLERHVDQFPRHVVQRPVQRRRTEHARLVAAAVDVSRVLSAVVVLPVLRGGVHFAADERERRRKRLPCHLLRDRVRRPRHDGRARAERRRSREGWIHPTNDVQLFSGHNATSIQHGGPSPTSDYYYLPNGPTTLSRRGAPTIDQTENEERHDKFSRIERRNRNRFKWKVGAYYRIKRSGFLKLGGRALYGSSSLSSSRRRVYRITFERR